MKDRNFVKEIEKLRTAVLGYDREEVVLYIRELVEYYGQKNEEAVRELYLEKMQLAAENAGLRAQIPTQEKLYAEAEGKAEEILAEAGRQMDVILTKTREKVEKQQALYHQYRSRLEALKNGLDCIFAGCLPEEDTRDLHGKPQRPGQIQADGLEETGLREQP